MIKIDKVYLDSKYQEEDIITYLENTLGAAVQIFNGETEDPFSQSNESALVLVNLGFVTNKTFSNGNVYYIPLTDNDTYESIVFKINQFIVDHSQETVLDDESTHKPTSTDDKVLDKLDQLRGRMFWRKVKGITIKFLLVITATVAAILYALSLLPDPYAYKITGRNVTDSRACTIYFPDGTEINGTRTYSYGYKQLFGYRWYDVTQVVEETTLRVKATGLLVAGHGSLAKKPDIQEVGIGEVTNLKLNNYPQYTFTLNGMMVVLDYKTICL